MWGRDPIERHEHFDSEGNFTGVTVVHRAPEFTREGVALMLAQRRLESDIGPHGIPMSEAMDPANQFAFEVPDKPRMDWAEKALAEKQDKYYRARPKDESRAGHKWHVKRRS